MPPAAATNQRILFAIVAVACTAGAVLLTNRWVKQQEARLADKEREIMANYQAPIDVVVAAKDVPEGTALEPAFLRMASVPERFVQPYAVRNAQELLGKITIAPLAKDEQIMTNKLRRPDEAPVGPVVGPAGPAGSTLSNLTPKGKRAVTIAVDTLSGVGGFVRPGDPVDVLWTIRLPSQNQKEGEPVTFTLFQDVPVLAVGADLGGRGPRSASSAAAKTEQGGNKEYTVTLALTPQEISFLLLTREQGRIQLSLRPKTDSGTQVSVVPANFNTLLEKQLGVKPQPPEPQQATPPQPAPPRQVEVFKGLKRTTVPLE